MLRSIIVLAVSLAATSVSAEQWADKMFPVKFHDFGHVARAAKVEYPFVIKNPFNSEVHIVAVRASCGCTQPRIVKDTLKPNEESAIIAAFNTRAFSGQRGARVTVTIDRPQYAEVMLEVKGYIRTDIVVDPGQVNLGSVAIGQTAEKKIRIDHAGRADWKITDVVSSSPFVTASLKELARQGDRVSYELDVLLKDGAPVGYLKDELQLTTNDNRAKQFPVLVEGLIVADLTVSPSTLLLGNLQPGQKLTKQLVVKGVKPFKILDMHCDQPGFSYDDNSEAKLVHLVPITYEAGRDIGKISTSIEIVTDLENNNTAKVPVIIQIIEPLAGK